MGTAVPFDDLAVGRLVDDDVVGVPGVEDGNGGVLAGSEEHGDVHAAPLDLLDGLFVVRRSVDAALLGKVPHLDRGIDRPRSQYRQIAVIQ